MQKIKKCKEKIAIYNSKGTKNAFFSNNVKKQAQKPLLENSTITTNRLENLFKQMGQNHNYTKTQLASTKKRNGRKCQFLKSSTITTNRLKNLQAKETKPKHTKTQLASTKKRNRRKSLFLESSICCNYTLRKPTKNTVSTPQTIAKSNIPK